MAGCETQDVNAIGIGSIIGRTKQPVPSWPRILSRRTAGKPIAY
jgi:hypothetical protein